MKSKRQEKILELIEKFNIETQKELIARLAECGIESKQTTVSRDIKELYLYKEHAAADAAAMRSPARRITLATPAACSSF